MTIQTYSEIATDPAQLPPDFSLVLGGPLLQIYRRIHLSGDALELLPRRIIVITLFAWAPLLLLSVIDGHAFGGSVKIPFLYDVEAHVRFLVALPILIGAEVYVHMRIGPLVLRFIERRIVVAADYPKFDAAIRSTLRLRNSITMEVTLLVLVYTLGFWLWRTHVSLEAATWYAQITHHLTLAGYWYAFVSIPLLQFILVRWYIRLGIWFRFLWKISRLNLHLSAAHPDKAGGIGFLGTASYAFAPILFAEGAMLAGLIASRVLYDGQKLLSFKLETAGFVGFFVLFILSPLMMFTPQLDRAKRKGSAKYGLLANRYVFGFEEKWMGEGDAAQTSELVGTADLQSLADLNTSYSVVREMHIVPFGLDDITRLAAATVAPLLPLLLTILSIEELLTRLVKIIF